ncbi:MAG: PilZ domain-containing protein [Polyangiales bacterium]
MTTRRNHERQDRRLRVRVTYEQGEFEAISRNLSLGGMYLVTTASLPLGTIATLHFRLPKLQETVVCEVFVRWNDSDGIGVQFGSLRVREVHALNQFLHKVKSEPSIPPGPPPLPPA